MPDNIKLKQYNLKTFLYNFIIIWNLLVIVLLILLTFHLNNKKVIKPSTINDIKVSGNFKILWQSKNEFQKSDPDIYYIDFIKSNNDKLYDFITLSKTGHLTAFDGENGQILFIQETGYSKAPFTITRSNIIIGNTNGELYTFTKTGKKAGVTRIAEPVKSRPAAVDTNIIIKNTNAVNTLTNTVVSGEKEKLWENMITGKIVDINQNFIQTRQGLYYISMPTGKILKSFNYFNSYLTGRLACGMFNDDNEADFLVCETNSIYCLDGLTLKELWHREIPYIISGNKNIISIDKKNLYVLLPLFNGIIKILNKYGYNVFEIKLNENLVQPPLVIKNKHHIFIQQTLQNNLYAFHFEKRKNIWSLNIPEKITDIRNLDINYDNINELFVLTENGKIYIINSENGAVLDYYSCLDNMSSEKTTSHLGVFDIDDDGNFEFCFATDKGNIYTYKYIIYNKKFIFNKFIKTLIKK